MSARLRRRSVGIVLLAPYLLVFLAFVVYPVGYGFWLRASRRAMSRCFTIRSSRAPRQHADLSPDASISKC